MKKYFAERNGFVKNADVILKNGINATVINVISSCISRLNEGLDADDELAGRAGPWAAYSSASYYQLCLAVWTKFFNKRSNDYGYYTGDSDALQRHLLSPSIPWYAKLSMIEFAIEYMEAEFKDAQRLQIKNDFVSELNSEFERIHYGYRIIDGVIIDIISDEEKKSIENALSTSDAAVKEHLKKALALYAQQPEPDYRNAIKESISAVEALLRLKTGESTFGPAYTKVKKSITIHPRIQEAIQKLYDYTNQPDTGIRHSKVEGDGTMVPDAAECQFMLVTCSAIINYFQEKIAKHWQEPKRQRSRE